MPAPDAYAPTQPMNHRRFLEGILSGDDSQPATRADVQALRAEVARLCELLQPPSAVILTGADVLQQFKRLDAGA